MSELPRTISGMSIPPESLASLINMGVGRRGCRLIAKTIPTMDVFESCRRNEITQEQAAEILTLQRESNYWIIRYLEQLGKYFMTVKKHIVRVL